MWTIKDSMKVSFEAYDLEADSAGGGVSHKGFINSERSVRTTSFRFAEIGLKAG